MYIPIPMFIIWTKSLEFDINFFSLLISSMYYVKNFWMHKFEKFAPPRSLGTSFTWEWEKRFIQFSKWPHQRSANEFFTLLSSYKYIEEEAHLSKVWYVRFGRHWGRFRSGYSVLLSNRVTSPNCIFCALRECSSTAMNLINLNLYR